jgi:hypothetical protein
MNKMTTYANLKQGFEQKLLREPGLSASRPGFVARLGLVGDKRRTMVAILGGVRPK